MTARPNLCSIPAAGITVDGIVDVLGGKSIVVGRIVGTSNTAALKGEVLALDGAGKVKTAAANAALATIAGVAVSSSVSGDIISVLRQGIARLVITDATGVTAIVTGDSISVYGSGKICKTGFNSTSEVIGKASSVGDGYVDVEINLLGTAV
jgi:hypothetical protein